MSSAIVTKAMNRPVKRSRIEYSTSDSSSSDSDSHVSGTEFSDSDSEDGSDRLGRQPSPSNSSLADQHGIPAVPQEGAGAPGAHPMGALGGASGHNPVVPLVADATKAGQRSYWFFTWNNPTCSSIRELGEKCLANTNRNGRPNIVGFHGQFERGDRGTLHAQFTVKFARSQRWQYVVAWFKEVMGQAASPAIYAVLNTARSNPHAAVKYCLKDDTREVGTEPFSFGDVPKAKNRGNGSGTRTDLAELREDVKSGRSWRWLINNKPNDVARYQKFISLMKEKFAGHIWKSHAADLSGYRKRNVIWLFGDTGTFKSRFALEEANKLAPDDYFCWDNGFWWSGYDMHSVVIMDDFRPSQLGQKHNLAFLLRLTDGYKFTVQPKFGTEILMAKTIIITSPDPPCEAFMKTTDQTPEKIDQLLRRIDTVYECKKEGVELHHPRTKTVIPKFIEVDGVQRLNHYVRGVHFNPQQAMALNF